MQNQKIKNIAFCICLIFILHPLLCLPLIIIEVYNKRHYALILLGCFMGLCAMLWPPTGDLYRHTMDYFDYIDKDEFELKLGQFDFILYYLSYVFANLGINFELVRFLFVFLSYMIIFFIFEDMGKTTEFITKHYRISLCIFFFSVPFCLIAFGLRYGFACSLMYLGLYYLLIKNRKIGWVYACLSIMTHYSLIVMLLLIWIVRLGINISSKRIVWFSFLSFIFLSSIFLEKIILLLPLPGFIQAAILAYVSGYWSGEHFEDHSLGFRLASILSYITIYPLVYYFLQIKEKSKLNSFLIIGICLWSVCSVSSELFVRTSLFLIFPLLLYMLSVVNMSGHLKKMQLILYFLIITFCSQLYSYRRVLGISDMYKLGYSSSASILFHTYDEEWIHKNVSFDGDPF